LNEQIVFGSHLPTGELCQHGWICFTSNSRREHLAGALAHQITCDRRELDSGIFQHLWQAIDRAGTFFDDAGAIPGKFAPFPLESRRDKAGAKQAMLHQIGDPFGIFQVGLASGDSFEVVRIDDEPFQHVKDRFPFQKLPVLSIATWVTFRL
jgi:hypothetical protein